MKNIITLRCIALLLSIALVCMGQYMVSVFLPLTDKAGVVLGGTAILTGVAGLVRLHIITIRR